MNNAIRFLREREIVHFQRFGECLRLCQEKMDQKNVYFTNPAFDPPRPQPRPAMENRRNILGGTKNVARSTERDMRNGTKAE